MAANAPILGTEGGSEFDRIGVRRVPFDAAWDWLALAWRDITRSPVTSLAYGAIFTIAAWLMTFGLSGLGLGSLILVLGGGFMLIGPLLATGLYVLSRSYEAGQSMTFLQSLRAAFQPKGQMLFFSFILMLAFLAWVQLAFLLLMLVIGGDAAVASDLKSFIFSGSGQRLFVIGTIAGALIATMVFAMSAVAAPLLSSRDVSALSAMAASVRAVLLNKGAMMLWAAIIVGLMVLGLVTMFAGLVVAFPLVGHATWHAMRALVVEG